ncbi:MAG: hypothetical protein AB1757_27630 [Acidobacteriota bacterium]
MIKKIPDIFLISAIASILSITAFLYFYHHNMTNLYGDGIAHVNIARKVVDSPDDSLWQRYMQIGSPWLPLQTVLMLPLVANDWLWRTGVAGSLISMFFFIITAISIWQLARSLYAKEANGYKNILPFVSFGIFALNPSVLFMQSTPMTELVFMGALAFAIWMLQRWTEEQTSRRLMIAAVAMTVATMARYEAWAVAAIACALALGLSKGNWQLKIKNAIYFSLIVAICPLYWLWHNRAIYGDALWFLRGPHSARGIYLQNAANLGWSRVFVGNAFLDGLLMTVTVAACVGIITILLGFSGFLRLVITRKRALIEHAPLLLFIVPFFFHCLSLYRGEIQIFPLSAFGLLNVRYGLPHLMALALFIPALIPLFVRLGKITSIVIICAMVAFQYFYLISDGVSQLAVYQEGYRNGVNSEAARQWAKVAAFTSANPPPTKILMQTGSLGPVVSQGRLKYAEIIHEGTSRWHQFDKAIPEDIETIIIEKRDALDERLKNNPVLMMDFSQNFREQFAAGNIRIFKRIPNP